MIAYCPSRQPFHSIPHPLRVKCRALPLSQAPAGPTSAAGDDAAAKVPGAGVEAGTPETPARAPKEAAEVADSAIAVPLDPTTPRTGPSTGPAATEAAGRQAAGPPGPHWLAAGPQRPSWQPPGLPTPPWQAGGPPQPNWPAAAPPTPWHPGAPPPRPSWQPAPPPRPNTGSGGPSCLNWHPITPQGANLHSGGRYPLDPLGPFTP